MASIEAHWSVGLLEEKVRAAGSLKNLRREGGGEKKMESGAEYSAESQIIAWESQSEMRPWDCI